MKWADFQPAFPRLFSNLFLVCTLLVPRLGIGQVLQFEKLDTPFEVFNQEGELLQLPFLGGFNVPRPQLVDIDGDGDQDLFVQELTNQLVFFERVSNPTGFPFVKKSDAFQELVVGEWYRFVDLDQDGDQDLLAETPFSMIRAYENTGGPTSPLFTLVQDSLRDDAGEPLFADRQNILNVVDIDADGLLDLFVGKLDGTVFHYEQTVRSASVQELAFSLQSERFQNISVVGEGGKQSGDQHGASTLLFHDVDQDGDQDLFWGDFFEAGLLFFENAGTPQIPIFSNEFVQFPIQDPLLTSGYNAPTFGDVDGDGIDDLIVGVLGGAFSAFGAATDNLLYFQQDASNQFSFVRARFFTNIDVGSDGYPVLFDVDGDRDNDLLIGNSIDPDDSNQGSLHLFENTGSASQPLFRDRGALPLEPAFGITPALGDLNGDGAVDMITGSFLGEMTLYINANDGTTFSFSETTTDYLDIASGSSSTPFLADMDADEDLDLLVGQSSGVINYFENTGTPEEPVFNLVTTSYSDIDVGRRSVPLAVDVDRDGDLDLIVGSDQDGIFTFENIGTPEAAEFVPVSWFDLGVQRRMAPAWGDLNGDSKPEVLVGLLNGGLHYYENRSLPLSNNPGLEANRKKVDLFPNPASEHVFLKITGARNQNVEVDVFTITGQHAKAAYRGVVYDDHTEVLVDLSLLAAGAYIIHIHIDGMVLREIAFKRR